MKSIIQDEKKCFITGQTYWLECHHVFFGRAYRKLSEKYGLKVWLTRELHRGTKGVHSNRELDLKLKRIAQKKFEEAYTFDDLPYKVTAGLKEGDIRGAFINMFGENYL